jgi:hypothetical protein
MDLSRPIRRTLRLIVRWSLRAIAVATAVAFAASAHAASEPEWSVARVWNEEALRSIRKASLPPPVNARLLFHLSLAMYDAWAVYDQVARPCVARERCSARDVESSRRQAIATAAWRILEHHFSEADESNSEHLRSIRRCAEAHGVAPDDRSVVGDRPCAVGNRVAQAVIREADLDGAQLSEGYRAARRYTPANPALVIAQPGNPTCIDPNRWQPLAFEFLTLQNSQILGAAIQEFTCPQWGQVKPFGLDPQLDRRGTTWLDPGPPPQLGGLGHEEAVRSHVDLIRLGALLGESRRELIDIGPGARHHSSMGTDDGRGYPANPVTGAPYEPVLARSDDYYRSIAEYWADGPHSESPPGHWNSIVNQHVLDHPAFVRRDRLGRQVDALEWDVKLYLVLNGALHDAAIVAWGIKSAYDGNRPVQVIRYLADRGQSTDPHLPRFDPLGLPLVPGLIEQIQPHDVRPGGKFAHLVEEVEDPYTGRIRLDSHVGELAILSWRPPAHGLDVDGSGGVGWILAGRYVPYQDLSQLTPPFAGYTSGHSCFSHAAAAALASFTGSEWFPGGIASETIPAGWLRFDDGPSADVHLTWARYLDAADEAAISRRYGGIHADYDDYPSRVLGAEIGPKAYAMAARYFTNTTGSPDINADGLVDALDLALMMEAWGACPPPCPADLNGDRSVDARDLGMLMGAWSERGSPRAWRGTELRQASQPSSGR